MTVRAWLKDRAKRLIIEYAVPRRKNGLMDRRTKAYQAWRNGHYRAQNNVARS